MSVNKLTVLSFGIVCLAVSVNGATPSDQSITDLFALMKLDEVYDQAIAATDAVITQALRAQSGAINESQQAAVTKTQDKIRQAISWSKMRDIYVQGYRDSYTQDEINGLIAFYKSPTGKAFAKKGPMVTTKLAVLVQQRIQTEMVKAQQELQLELQQTK